MKALIAAAALLLLAAATPALAVDVEADVAAARAVVKTFATTLQGALKAAVAEDGFAHAIGVCHQAAPEIAEAVSAESGWRVGRTALRLRNPENAPSAAERAVLEDFLRRAEAGEDIAKMEHTAEIQRDGRRMLHYMKAIPVGEVCTTCHGQSVEPALLARIRQSYPADQATGFALGDLRGAFTLYKPLD